MQSLRGPRPIGERRGSPPGQVLVLFTIFLTVLIGFTALTVDYGTYLVARRDYQNIADSAALAGSVYLTRPIDNTKRGDALEASWAYLRDQLGLVRPPDPRSGTGAAPFLEGGWSIWVETPPTNAGPAYTGDPTISGDLSVFVRVERENPSYLSRIFGFNGRTIDGWATAGTLPSRWAVIALCPRNDPTCPPTAQDVTINGTTTYLKIIDGDMGDNWGLKTNGNNQVILPGDSQAYLVDTTCGASTFDCYPDPTNINDGSGNPKRVRVLPAPVEDPNYAEPTWLTDPIRVPARPVYAPHGSGLGSIQNPSGTNVRCGPGSPSIGPGTYARIDVPANSCLILDPTLGLTVGQQPGVFRITDRFDIGNGSYVVGDAVSLFFDSGMTPFNPSGGIIINTGNQGVSGVTAAKYGAWTTDGVSPWSQYTGSPPTYNNAPGGTGIAFYVRRPVSGVTQVFNMSGTTPLMFQGILYGPRDKLGIAGSGLQAAVGQLIGWTITYSGNTTITQTFDGPADSKSYLLEPRTGQGD